jgi:primosomal protein N' (replication factor Y)
MQIVTVAPIVRGVLREKLSYFSKEHLEVGMVIVVPVRTREIPAIVLETKMASDEKSTIKTSDYAIRKITRAHPRRIWSPAFLKAVEETANYSAQKFGETLLSLTPKAILDAHLANELSLQNLDSLHISSKKARVLAIQNDTKKRHEEWERLVRESFARDESVYICLPTEDDVLRMTQRLERGIAEYTFALHGSLPKKRALERWDAICTEKHAVLVIGTAQYLGLPRYFKTIVLDEEQASTWKTIAGPIIDQRFFAERYASALGSTLIIGAPLLRAETYARVLNGSIDEFGRIAAHSPANIHTAIIDPRIEEKSIHDSIGKYEFVILTSELRDLIQKAKNEGKPMLLIAARKGLSPVTACGDCGALVRCPECDTPLVIHQKHPTQKPNEAISTDTRMFVCHACGFMRTPENNIHETCNKCGGWKLQGVGIGTDRIESEVQKYFPDIKLFVLDGDRAKTRVQAKKIVEEFKKSPGSVLIATPTAIPLITQIDYSSVVSLDSLFAVPDIRMSERIFALVLALREKTTNTLLVQTRADDPTLFSQALLGDLVQFTRNELELRKAFFYPPYGTIVKLTIRGKRNETIDEMMRLKTFLDSYSPVVSGTLSKEPKNIFRMHLILKLAEGSWPNAFLLAKLRALPSQISCEIDPSNLL